MFCSCVSSLTVVSTETGRTVSRIKEVRSCVADLLQTTWGPHDAVATGFHLKFTSHNIPSSPLLTPSPLPLPPPQEEDTLTSLAVSGDGKVHCNAVDVGV